MSRPTVPESPIELKTPTAEVFAEVEAVGGARRVRLPPAFAAEARALFTRWGGRAEEAPEDPTLLWVSARSLPRLLRALDEVKPTRLDAQGLPLPWVPPVPRVEPLGVPGDAEGDALPMGDEPPPPSDGLPLDAALEALARRLFALAGVAPAPLVVKRQARPDGGFCRGRVWLTGPRAAGRVWLSPCPNADLAELAATLTHEIAHPASGTATHSREFKRSLIDLCGRAWGPAYFAAASPAQSYGEVDRWVAVGIRAALLGRPPPAQRTCDTGDAARVVSRIRKLQALANAQPGEPEAITAMGRANDLITAYGLGGYGVQIASGIDEQMVDKWVKIGARRRWEQILSYEICRFFGVFLLTMPHVARQHFFGRHADVVAATFLREICVEKISRACARHLEVWRAAAHRPRGATQRERTAFCDNAVMAFGEKLRALRAADEGQSDEALDVAERFAFTESARRGRQWGTSSAKRITPNAAGAAAGAALEVTRGVEGEAPKQLPG